MNMNPETKKLTIIGIAALVLIGGSVLLFAISPKENVVAEKKILYRDNSHTTAIGPVASVVVMVEFGDYQCPACGFAHPIIKKVLNEYGGKVTLVYRHFPLAQHRHSGIAAEAAEAAAQEGKFWEMHNRLYEDQKRWSDSDKPLDIFLEYAREFGLNTEKFKQSVESSAFKDVIANDQKDGASAGVSGTPTLFINGEQYSGPFSYEALKAKIDSIQKKN